jgi:hypothetical protein
MPKLDTRQDSAERLHCFPITKKRRAEKEDNVVKAMAFLHKAIRRDVKRKARATICTLGLMSYMSVWYLFASTNYGLSTIPHHQSHPCPHRRHHRRRLSINFA